MIEVEVATENPLLRSICERYWKVEPDGGFGEIVKEIADDAGLSSSEVLQIVRKESRAFVDGAECSRCAVKIEACSRSEYKSVIRRSSWTCPACVEIERNERRLKEKQEEEGRRDAVKALYDFPFGPPPEPKDLDFAEAVYLLSFVRAGASENLSSVSRLNEFTITLTPSDGFDLEVVRVLQDCGLIRVHSGSAIDSFCFENGVPGRYFVEEVRWRLLLGKNPAEVRQYLSGLEGIFRDMDWPDRWMEQSVELWRLVARYECLEYLEERLSEHGIPFESDERAVSVVDGLLRSFSVSQRTCEKPQSSRRSMRWIMATCTNASLDSVVVS